MQLPLEIQAIFSLSCGFGDADAVPGPIGSTNRSIVALTTLGDCGYKLENN